jgi:hypothetical protein
VLGDTTVVFEEPAYEGARGTLVLNNATIDTGSDNGISGSNLNIRLLGENTVVGKNRGIYQSGKYIEGPGSLYVKGQYGIECNRLSITDAQVTAEGTTRYAIDADQTTLNGAQTIVKLRCEPDARGTFKASTSLTLNDGIAIEEPEGAQYVDSEIKDDSGNVIKDQWVTLQYTAHYGLYVAGTEVTNHNMADVLGDGTVSYDPETQTLTLNNANIDGGLKNGIEANQELHINLVGDNTIESDLSLGSKGTGILFNTNTGYIEGTGSLTINAPYGIDAKANALKILGGAKVTACALNLGIRSGLTTISSEETVVNTKGDEASFACMGLTLNDGLEIVEPEDAKFVMTKAAICVGRRNDIVTSWVKIMKVNTYDLYVAGTQVTDKNKADVLGDGTVSYDPETNTLTLNNAHIVATGESGVEGYGIDVYNNLTGFLPDFTIKLEGENSIESLVAIQAGTSYNKSIVFIKGPGSLRCTGLWGFYLNSTYDLIISDGAMVTVEGTDGYAIFTSTLTVSGAETVLYMKGAETYRGSSPVLEDGLIIGMPVGAYYDTETHQLVDAEGEVITNQWVIIASQDYIDGVETLSSSPLKGDGIFNLAGQKVDANYKGIVIQNGRKVLKK